MQSEKNIPYTYGNLGLFLGAVCIVCGIITASAPLIAAGSLAVVAGGAYLSFARKRRSEPSE